MNIPAKILSKIGTWLPICVIYPQTKNQRRANNIWLAIIFLVGLAAWGYFFSWGQFPLGFHDWADISGPRLQFLKEAATKLEFPLTLASTRALNEVTDRYLSVPDTIISPQFIFMRWLDLKTYILINFWFFYALGFWGLLKIRSRFHLSPLVFTFIFVLFNFNGHVLAHFSIGHYTWLGYFLFPCVVLLLHDLINGDHSWVWVAKWSALLFVMLLQGSFHQFVWVILLILLTAVLVPHTFWWSVRGAFFACLASLFRILPPILIVDRFDNQFLTGFHSLYQLWQAFVATVRIGDSTGKIGAFLPVGPWEITFYIGLAGAAFLTLFGIVQWMRRDDSGIDRGLAFPLLGLTLLSMGTVYEVFSRLPVPLFRGEHVSTRLISLVFVFLLAVAASVCQRWLDRQNRGPFITGGMLIWLVFLIQDMRENMVIWRLENAAAEFDQVVFDPTISLLNNNYNDRGYILLVLGSLAVSVAVLAGLGWLSWRERQQMRSSL